MASSALAISDSVDPVQFYSSELVDDFDDGPKFNESLSAQYDTIFIDTPGGSVSSNFHVEPIAVRRSRNYFMDSIKTHMNAVSTLALDPIDHQDPDSIVLDPDIMITGRPYVFTLGGQYVIAIKKDTEEVGLFYIPAEW